jgi:hypothetical protein
MIDELYKARILLRSKKTPANAPEAFKIILNTLRKHENEIKIMKKKLLRQK